MKKSILQLLIFSLAFLSYPSLVQAQLQSNNCSADINLDGVVDLSDYSILAANLLKVNLTNQRADINGDGVSDLSDYSILAANLLKPLSGCQPTPSIIPQMPLTTWYQDGGNAQRTGFVDLEPKQPWTYAWSFNGSDSAGKIGGHFYDIGHNAIRSPRWEGRTIAVADQLIVPALNQGLYSLNLKTGNTNWNNKQATFKATPVYDLVSNSIFVGGDDGRLYKISLSGQALGNYNAGSPLNLSLATGDGYVYALTESGQLHKVSTTTLTAAWVYNANSASASPPSLSTKHKVVVLATDDLFVHGIDLDSGARKWRVKPTVNPASNVYTFKGYYPVIADSKGLVLIRMSIGMNGLWSGPQTGNKWPNTNSETRAFLESNPQYKNLFALNLSNGSTAFVPAVGPGGTEGLLDNSAFLENGPPPVVKTLADGSQIAYAHFRNGQTKESYYDGRWDSHLGEMMLDNNTVPGYQAGDLRFVQFDNSYITITDEQNPLTMAGNTIFHSHWGALESSTIMNRSSNLGNLLSNPITSKSNPPVIRRMQTCGNFNAATHWTTCGLTLLNDGRYWQGPGFWTYWGVMDPPTPVRGAYSEGILPRYAYVSQGYVIVQGNGGEIMVFKHN